MGISELLKIQAAPWVIGCKVIRFKKNKTKQNTIIKTGNLGGDIMVAWMKVMAMG